MSAIPLEKRATRRIRFYPKRIEIHLIITDMTPLGVWRKLKRAANDTIRMLEHNKKVDRELRTARRKVG